MEGGSQTFAIGIDLGTTNTCVAVYRDGRAEMIQNKLGDFLTPSWVAYTENEVLIGKTAKNNAHRNLDGTLFGIKRIIGRKYNDFAVQEAIKNWKFKIREHKSGIPKIEVFRKNKTESFYPEEVSSLLLTEMKEIAEAFLGVDHIRDVVITVPAYFNDHQRQATKDAAKIAKLNVLRLINEPTAAAIAYIYDKPSKKEHNVLVYDLGGGTFDVSIVSLEGCNVWVKATRGDTNLGGSNFDERCVEHVRNLIDTKYSIDMQDAMKLKLLRRLLNKVENAKHDLATAVTTTIELDAIYQDIDMAEELTRARFDDLNEDLYRKTFKIVEQCINEAKLQKEDIDDIVIVGGSTRIVKLQEMLEDFFGKPVSKAINPDQAVAHGAAILAAKLKGILPIPLNIMDVVPMSLGIEIHNEKMNILIRRNSQIPTEAHRSYTTAVPGENSIRITVLEGDSRHAKRNLKLGYFDLLDLPENSTVNVTFKVDIDGIVTVSAEEISSGISKTIDVALNKGRLSDKKIAILRRTSNILKEGNEKFNLIKDKRNAFESFILQLKDDIIKNKHGITKMQQDVVLNMTEEALSWLKTEDGYNFEKIEKKQSSINNYCKMLFPG